MARMRLIPATAALERRVGGGADPAHLEPGAVDDRRASAGLASFSRSSALDHAEIDQDVAHGDLGRAAGAVLGLDADAEAAVGHRSPR